MKGGVVPERLREFETRLASVNRALGGFPLQSQHEGNCASDAIQIVLFFSDGIGRRFARQAIREYNEMRPDIYNEDWITQQLRRVQAGDGMYDTLGDIYARITSVRYLRMIDEYEQRVEPVGTGLARTESQGLSIRRGNVRTPIGVLCSSVFAVANTLALSREERERNPDLPRQTEDILTTEGERNKYYGYGQTNYDPIVRRVLAKIAPNSVLATGRVTEQEQQVEGRFIGRYLADTAPELQRIVGVQLFFYEERTQPGRDGRGFHTLSLFKHGGNWFIGDNEVGFAIPLPQDINNTQHILNNKFSFVATVIGEVTVRDRRMYRYERVFYTHPITANGTLGAGVEIARANYFLTSRTSGTYVHSYENVGSRRTQYPMPRKYFIPPPDEPDVWHGAEPAEGAYQRRIFEQTLQVRRPARRPMEPIPQEEEEAPLEDTVEAAAATGAPVADGFVGLMGFAAGVAARRAAAAAEDEARRAAAAALPVGFGFPGTEAAAVPPRPVAAAPPAGPFGFVTGAPAARPVESLENEVRRVIVPDARLTVRHVPSSNEIMYDITRVKLPKVYIRRVGGDTEKKVIIGIDSDYVFVLPSGRTIPFGTQPAAAPRPVAAAPRPVAAAPPVVSTMKPDPFGIENISRRFAALNPELAGRMDAERRREAEEYEAARFLAAEAAAERQRQAAAAAEAEAERQRQEAERAAAAPLSYYVPGTRRPPIKKPVKKAPLSVSNNPTKIGDVIKISENGITEKYTVTGIANGIMTVRTTNAAGGLRTMNFRLAMPLESSPYERIIWEPTGTSLGLTEKLVLVPPSGGRRTRRARKSRPTRRRR